MAPRGRPSKVKAQAKRPRARKPPKDDAAKVRDLEKRLAEAVDQLLTRDRELSESLSQQTATGEILGVIAGSPTDIGPVLDTVARSAARLCEANDVLIFRRDDDQLILVSHHGAIPPGGSIGEFSRPLVRGSLTGRTVLEGRTLHIADLQAETDEFPEGSDLA